MKLAYKVWLDSNGKAFGEGPYRLLRNVEQTGSLWKAATEMGMSYSKAWRLMGNLERRLNFRLLERHAGGASGGGSLITPKGRDLLDRYEKFQKDVDGALEKTYKKHFGSLKWSRTGKAPACRQAGVVPKKRPQGANIPYQRTNSPMGRTRGPLGSG